MAENTKIQWADHTWNPWRGCTKVATGCARCYAETLSKRNPGTLGIWGPNGTRVLASESMWRQPLKWNEKAEAMEQYHAAHLSHDPVRPRVFCASLADVFEDWHGPIVDANGGTIEVCQKSILCETLCVAGEHKANCVATHRPATMDDVRLRLFALIDATPHLDWLILTKRPENIRRMWPQMDSQGHGWHLRNVWLGTSIANQEDADRNIPLLLQCRDLSPVLFVSYEPAVGPVDFELVRGALSETCHYGESHSTRECDCEFGIDWLIIGGESGPGARPCNIEWIRSAVRQCKAAGVSVFVKQLGSHVMHPGIQNAHIAHLTEWWPRETRFDGEHVLLRDKKGGDPSEWPSDLRVREFPKGGV